MKSRLDDLAVFGGSPAFAEALHVGRPNIPDRDRLFARIGSALDRRWLTNDGPLVRELEDRLAAESGVAHCVATCNATVALQILARAVGLAGEVILPAFTFVATAHAVTWAGATPVFCDVDPATHNLDPAQLERAITPRTTGIIGVHVWGRPCDVDALEAIARAHALTLLFDAAHAYGCSRGPSMIGGFGRAEVFSFHATKFLNAFEGGAIATNDAALADRLRQLRNFGFVDFDTVGGLGTNGKMSEVSAAMALTSIEHATEWIDLNRRHYAAYGAGLAGVPGVSLVAYDDRHRSNYQYVVVEIDERVAGISRDRLQQVLWADNILARRYFFPGCHRMEPYRSERPRAYLPQTDRLVESVLTLPTGTAVSDSDIATVCALIRLVVARGPELSARLSMQSDPAGVER